jgi:intraflagellar transport protein 43
LECLQVAAAPKVRTNKVQGMTELDEDMQYRLPNTDDRDIDLSLLTTVLCSSEQVRHRNDSDKGPTCHLHVVVV